MCMLAREGFSEEVGWATSEKVQELILGHLEKELV